ncbi:hypothetical protein MKX01_002465 [Papaver californicum]|nr:hypothetical protein MKX01_002465 [Papaver californicum]
MDNLGFVISDWMGLDKLTAPEHANYTHFVKAGINTGIDMLMQCKIRYSIANTSCAYCCRLKFIPQRSSIVFQKSSSSGNILWVGMGTMASRDSVVQSVADGGILMCTATDMAVLCGTMGRYGSYPLRGKYCHKMALRIVLACIESHANRYKRYIVPVLSV